MLIHFQDVELYQNSIQVQLKKKGKRTMEVWEADDSERHTGIIKQTKQNTKKQRK